MNRLWRIAATGMFFALLFGGGAILALTAFPIIHLTTPSPEKRRTRNQVAIHKAFQIYVALLQALQVLDLKIIGAEKLNDARWPDDCGQSSVSARCGLSDGAGAPIPMHRQK